MQRLGLHAAMWCVVLGALVTLPLSPAGRAQAGRAQPILETPQQVNDRIRELSSSLRMMPHDYVIGAGDLLNIYVFDVEELSREVRVSQTGTIGIPLVPVRLHVAGLTEMQVEQKIEEVLEANGLVTRADVSVSVKEHKSKPITIVGAVPHPMVYEADRPVTLLEVLAEAGGIANDAGDTVIVSRPSQEAASDTGEPPEIGPEQSLPAKAPPAAASPRSSVANADPPPLANTITVNLGNLMETGDTANNIALQAGDIVTVPHAGVVYVLGAVGRAGGYVLSNDRSQLTTLKILSLAGGLTRTAKSEKAVIVRKDNAGQQHEVPIDLKRVLNRKAEDLQLQPSDILYVPESGSKQALFRAAEFGLALGSGVALYRIAYQH
jgi:polysaccharide export outer membrane protein